MRIQDDQCIGGCIQTLLFYRDIAYNSLTHGDRSKGVGDVGDHKYGKIIVLQGCIEASIGRAVVCNRIVEVVGVIVATDQARIVSDFMCCVIQNIRQRKCRLVQVADIQICSSGCRSWGIDTSGGQINSQCSSRHGGAGSIGDQQCEGPILLADDQGSRLPCGGDHHLGRYILEPNAGKTE